MSSKTTGFQFAVCVDDAGDKGRGVFAGEAIRKGSVVWRHEPGAFRVFDESGFKTMIAGLSAADVVFELTHVFGFEDFPGCLIRALDDGILINHSCDPNLVANNRGRASNTLDTRSEQYLQDVEQALFDDRYSLLAKRDIRIGEELTNDYNLDDDCPPYYDELYERFGVREDFLD